MRLKTVLYEKPSFLYNETITKIYLAKLMKKWYNNKN